MDRATKKYGVELVCPGEFRVRFELSISKEAVVNTKLHWQAIMFGNRFLEFPQNILFGVGSTKQLHGSPQYAPFSSLWLDCSTRNV
jgi:hypothetical protein